MRAKIAPLAAALAVALAAGQAYAGGGAKAKHGHYQQSSAKVSGTVVDTSGATLYIQGQDGTVVPIQVSRDTSIGGHELSEMTRIGPTLERSFQPGEPVVIVFQVVRLRTGKLENRALDVSPGA